MVEGSNIPKFPPPSLGQSGNVISVAMNVLDAQLVMAKGLHNVHFPDDMEQKMLPAIIQSLATIYAAHWENMAEPNARTRLDSRA